MLFASLLVLILWYIAFENNHDSNFLDLGLCLVLWALRSELLLQFSLLALALVWLSMDCYKHRHEELRFICCVRDHQTCNYRLL